MFSSFNSSGDKSIGLNFVNSIEQGRSGYEIKVEQQGGGALVLPGRWIHVRTPGLGGSGVIAIHDHVFTAGKGDALHPIKQIEGALYGTKEGARIIVTPQGGGSSVTVEILKVCSDSLISKLGSCSSLPPDKISTRLKDCVTFAESSCAEAVKKPLLNVFMDSNDFAYIEYCIVNDIQACRNLVNFLAASNKGEYQRYVGNMKALLQFAMLTENDIAAARVKANPTAPSSVLLQDFSDFTVNSDRVAALVKVINAGHPESDVIASTIAYGLFSQLPEYRQKYTSALGPVANSIPPILAKMIERRKAAQERKESLKKYLETLPPDALARKLASGEISEAEFKQIPLQQLLVPDANDYTLLMVAVLSKNQQALVYMAGNRLALNSKNAKGETVWHLMAEQDEYYDLKNRIAENPNLLALNVADSQGRTPLSIAKEAGYLSLAKFLSEQIKK